MKNFLIALLITGFSSGAFAADKLGLYTGIGLTAAYVEADPRDATVLGAHIDVGYRHNPYLATEVSFGVSEATKSDVTGYSIGFSVLPMLPLNEDTDIFLSFNYGVVTSNDFLDFDGEIEDGFGVGIGFMHHMNNIYVRGNLATAFDDGTESVGLGLDIGFKF